MIVEINTDAKTITIESATAKEIKKLAKQYSNYTFISKDTNWSYYPYWGQPFYVETIPTIPYYETTISHIDCIGNDTFTVQNTLGNINGIIFSNQWKLTT